ncbi:MAG: hypothetical protein UR23_C0016G0005 [Candidatus Roizmanbacteria bacterium GW2011_GWA2_32_13]|uniref:Uncharacterized protein n=1 Tax=Candidatus Roizmanbacteria bacterium GW2011_GWA2_32_13 TaxID=1618475 RepID=A0A0G0BCM3_9BACT|nr:MAG: hypothetical protein UR23_C0016G0005 [Candidatus Roizmanbacteria bacterium GW2011_GWA2_32_13]
MKEKNSPIKKIECPKCGSKNYTFTGTHFDHANTLRGSTKCMMCNDCGETFNAEIMEE